ncbi:MAG: class I SAM-dependent methyltransferase [Gemmataceae bacterium]
MSQTDDPTLAELTSALGLERPPSTEAWEERLRTRLDPEVYAEYLEHRMGYAGEEGPDAQSAFYELAGRSAALALLLLEGRLAYHGVVLPAVAEAVAAGPHGTILDLGCNCGLTTLYLAKRFPGSRVVGIERSAGLVARARDLLGRVGLANAEFFCGDYTRQLAAGLFDVVVSLHTMPAHLLPFLPSQEPESYRRGPDLFALADDPALPHRRVAWALEAVGRLARKPGRAVLHERLVSVPKVLLFSLLAARAGLTVRAMRPLTWQSPAEMHPGPQTNPLIAADVTAAPSDFDEGRVIDLCQPEGPPALPAAPPAGSNSVLVASGHLAHWHAQSLPAAAQEVLVRAAITDGSRQHLRLGVVPGRLSFAYGCDTLDRRDLKIAEPGLAGQLAANELESLNRGVRSGMIAALDPPLAKLPALLRPLLRAA